MSPCASSSSAAAASAATSADGWPRPGADVAVRRARRAPRGAAGPRAADREPEGRRPPAAACARPSDPASIGPVDVVFFAVKLYDTERGRRPAAAAHRARHGRGSACRTASTAWTCCRASSGREHVAGGAAYVAAVIAEPGVIRHTAMDHLIFGELDGPRSPRLERLLEACRPPASSATLSDAHHRRHLDEVRRGCRCSAA